MVGHHMSSWQLRIAFSSVVDNDDDLEPTPPYNRAPFNGGKNRIVLLHTQRSPAPSTLHYPVPDVPYPLVNRKETIYRPNCRVRGVSDYPWRTFWETLLGIVRYHDWGSSVVTVYQHGEGGDSCQCDASCVSRWTKQEEVSELYLPGVFVECLCGECNDCVLFIIALITIVITIVICSGKTKARKHVLNA